MAKNRKRRRRRVPEILWRLFRHRACTLSDTIASLIPPSRPDCGCNGRRCLGCIGGDAGSYLLRPGDPSEYRKLLNECFVVVSHDAPPLSTLYLDRRWSQQQIVRKTIEMIMCEQPGSSNVLCRGYSKISSPTSRKVYALEEACTVWEGVSIDQKEESSSTEMPLRMAIHNIEITLGKGGQLARAAGAVAKLIAKEGKSATLKLPSGECSNSSSIVELLACSAWDLLLERVGDDTMVYLLKHTSIFLPRPHKMHCQVAGPPISDLCVGLPKHISDSERQQPSLTYLGTQKKRARIDGAADLTSKEQKLTSSFCPGGPCSCCLLLQASPKVSIGAYIDRKTMFHKLERSLSVIPRKHILNSLKPNFSGANVLLRDILGLSDGNVTESKQCFHNTASCLVGSSCLYHSLVSLLALLIRKTQSCQHLRLLDKHCATPSLGQNANENALCMSEGTESGIKSSEKGELIAQLDSVWQKSHVLESKHLKETLHVLSHQFEPHRSYCSKSQVTNFIWAVCKRIMPPRLLGTPPNWRILRKKISKFVWLRRFEKLSLKECMHKVKISRFPWLSNEHSSCYLSNHVLEYTTGKSMDTNKRCRELNDAIYIMKHKILERWIFWFFSSLVVPLVQANFYVTESEHGKNDMFYYQKSVWEMLMNNATNCLKEQSYCSLDDVSVRQILSHRSFGFSRLRFRPKENGVRALANLNGSSKFPVRDSSLKDQSWGTQRKAQLHPERVKFDHFKPVNFVLRDLHAVLKGLQMKEPEKLGSSIFDYNDVYRNLCSFLISVKNGSTTIPSVFMVVSDVSKAFDSVNQDKLLSVMKDVIVKGKYLLKQSCEVVCSRKALWVYENQILVDQNIGTGLTESTSSVSAHSLHSVLVNQVRRRTIGRRELYFKLNEHVKRNVLQLGNKFYLQNCGIPQGSVLSSLLCSFYYGDMDRNVIFPFLEKSCAPATEHVSEKDNCHYASAAQLSSSENNVILASPKYMLLRFIDDFLFLSTSKQQAASFFSRLQRGFRDYNCYMNECKFGMNFDIGHTSSLPPSRIYVGEDGISFLRWSGLLINCCSLEVQADYTRYTNSHLSSTLTVCWQGRPGLQLKERLFNYIQLRCHPLFYDSNINAPATVRLNIYQAFLLSAMKFHCYTRNLSNICKLQSGYHMEIIEKALRLMYTFIKKRMHSMDLNSSFRPILQLKKGEVLWLGLNAFIRVLKRKQSCYKELLSLLKSKLLRHPFPETAAASHLKYAIDDSHSSLLWKIKY